VLLIRPAGCTQTERAPDLAAAEDVVVISTARSVCQSFMGVATAWWTRYHLSRVPSIWHHVPMVMAPRRQISVRVNEAELARLNAYAASLSRTVNDIIREIIRGLPPPPASPSKPVRKR
jgi:hypothetical protein